jgi:hypothetical protein
MKMQNTIQRLLWGTPFKQEYLCTPLETHFPRLELIANDQYRLTDRHVFVGYRPLLIGLWDEKIAREMTEPGASIAWQYQDQQVARVSFSYQTSIPFEGKMLYIFEGTHGSHSFLPKSIQWRHNWRQRLMNRQNGVYLKPALYDQVKAAYAIPRKISLISVGNTEAGNRIPNDLHGPMGEDHYAISLREAGKAHQQVAGAGKILLAEREMSKAPLLYKIGKNHMRDLRKLEHGLEAAQQIEQWALPGGLKGYRLLERTTGQTVSIHHIHIFRVTDSATFASEQPTLAHIHRDYATWRWRMGFDTKYVDR